MIAGRLGQRFNTDDDVGKYLVGERRHQHAYGVAGRPGEQVRCPIGDVTDLFCGRKNAFAQAFRHGVGVAQAAAHRHFGGPDAIRNVL